MWPSDLWPVEKFAALQLPLQELKYYRGTVLHGRDIDRSTDRRILMFPREFLWSRNSSDLDRDFFELTYWNR